MGQASGKEKGDSSTQTVDGGHLVPQGVYSAVQDYNHDVVQGIIKARKLAPFYQGLDDEDAYSEAPFNTECPICFLVSRSAFLYMLFGELVADSWRFTSLSTIPRL